MWGWSLNLVMEVLLSILGSTGTSVYGVRFSFFPFFALFCRSWNGFSWANRHCGCWPNVSHFGVCVCVCLCLRAYVHACSPNADKRSVDHITVEIISIIHKPSQPGTTVWLKISQMSQSTTLSSRGFGDALVGLGEGEVDGMSWSHPWLWTTEHNLICSV